MTDDAPIVVLGVVGTGDPMDAILILPLVYQWGASRACATEAEEPCEVPLTRIVTLADPGLTDDNGHTSRTLAYCEDHFRSFIDRARQEAVPA